MQTGVRGRRARLILVGTCLAALLTVGGLTLDRYSAPPALAQTCVPRAAPAVPEPGAIGRPAQRHPRWLVQRAGAVDDASCLNRTDVFGVARPRSVEEARRALALARTVGVPVTAAGTRHSMGGQAFTERGLLLDMRDMNRVRVEVSSNTVRVQAGATWHQVLEEVHRHGLSVAAMPSIDVLSVGGTLSSNAHGADFRTGSIASTVRSLRVMLADGSVHTVDRSHRPDLFRALIGGYGLFGVILEAELEAVPSEMYRLRQRTVSTDQFPRIFADQVQADERNRLMFVHLSTAPTTFLDEGILYTYSRLDGYGGGVPPLRPEGDSRFARLMLNLARHGGLGQRLKWEAQQHLLPRVRRCHEPRNEALRVGEACLVSRNQAMYNDLALLRNRLTEYTDILQEYFLPPDRLVPFLRDARDTLRDHDAELLSASIRSVHDAEILLDYARGPRLSVVFYLSQKTTSAGNADMAALTRKLVAEALDHDATFYLPYQLHYTRADLERAYPMIDEFFALKRRYDPEAVFVNSLYRRFGGPSAEPLPTP